MWETIKNALSSVKEATGIEIPGLPADLGSIGESATTTLQSLAESATGGIDGAATATESVTGGLGELATTATEAATSGVDGLAETATAATEAATAGVDGLSEAGTTAIDSMSQALPDITGGLVGGPAKS